MRSTLENLFRLQENGTTVRTELNAGLTTFVSMAYIIFVNPAILSLTGMDSGAVMAATCLSAALGTLLSALLSNRPYVMAAGMGLNTFFAFTLCGGAYGYNWQQALALTFVAGLVFFLITLTPLRDRLIAAIPGDLKHAISAGIGLFIALIGLLNAGVITMTDGFPAIGDLGSPQVLLALFGVAATAVLIVRGVKAPLLLGILLTVLAGLVTGQAALPSALVAPPTALKEVFMRMEFAGLVSGARPLFTVIALIFSMAFVDIFDTVGFLVGASSGEDDPAMGRVLIADAAGTVLGAVCGTSTVTTFAESATGISAGGCTGLTAVTASVCFLLAMFFTPLAGLLTAAATAPALIVVGLYMFADIKNTDLARMDSAIPVFFTVLMMPLSYSITTGIGVGFIAWTLCKLSAGRVKELNWLLIVLSVLFGLYFCL